MLANCATNQELKDFVLGNIDERYVALAESIYDRLQALFFAWGVPSIPDAEISIKITHDQIDFNRFSIPVMAQPDITMEMVWQIIDILGAPQDIGHIAQQEFSSLIRLLVGIDFDHGGKRMYFNRGEAAFGYEFYDDRGYKCKGYRLIQKEKHPAVLNHLEKIGGPGNWMKTVLQILPFDNWDIICGRSNLLTKIFEPIGYHLSLLNKVKIRELSDSIAALASALCPAGNSTLINSWLGKNQDCYLHWLGVSMNQAQKPEVNLYIRPGLSKWDEFYRPRDFISFFRLIKNR